MPDEDLFILTPHLPANRSHGANIEAQKYLLQKIFSEQELGDHIAWYYTPMALEFSSDLLSPQLIVYDCMDELSAFQNAPPELIEREAELMKLADIVFTGGNSLYGAKKDLHSNVHSCPSSIDKEHFGSARRLVLQPADQQAIPHPRLGFFGVIDERLDIALLDAIAVQRPDWHIIMIGPTVKVDPSKLPRYNNVHYLGSKSYHELPLYLAGWDVALLPFARNASTRFISPTKTPEYLAGGKPVVSTSIEDVVNPYGREGLVEIADDPVDFISAIEKLLSGKDNKSRLQAVDRFLADMSWDATWAKMLDQMNIILEEKRQNFPSIKMLKHV